MGGKQSMQKKRYAAGASTEVNYPQWSWTGWVGGPRVDTLQDILQD